MPMLSTSSGKFTVRFLPPFFSTHQYPTEDEANEERFRLV